MCFPFSLSYRSLAVRSLSMVCLAGFVCSGARSAPLDDVRASLRLEQRGQALKQLQAYLSDQPDDPEALFLKGRVLAEMGHGAEAQEVFTDLIRKFPQLPEPYNNLAALHAKDRNLEKARDVLLAAIQVRPDYRVSYQNLGDIYTAMAREAYGQAQRIAATDTGGRRDPARRADPAATSPAVAGPITTFTAPVTAPTPAANSKAPSDSRADGSAQAFADWQHAWERQDVARYLAFYARDFRPASGTTRESWEAQRRQRLQKPAGIRLQVQHPRWTSLDSGRSRVEFGLQYSSGKMKVRSTKVMVWAWRDGRWQIESESAG